VNLFANQSSSVEDSIPILQRWDSVIAPEACGQIIAYMQASKNTDGLVLRGGIESLDLETRVCNVHQVPQTIVDRVLQCILHLKKEILEYFNLPSCSTNGPYLVSYSRGAFFRLHQDTANNINDPLCVTDRELTIVLYLNGREETTYTPSFDGGALAVYDPSHPGSSGRLLVIPQVGTLVAFRSKCLHEVLTIHEGVRYAVLCWFLKH
jgi:predicted 2-oxoglutarate/Fe(II)-dependent dioxygenase YbiX